MIVDRLAGAHQRRSRTRRPARRPRRSCRAAAGWSGRRRRARSRRAALRRALLAQLAARRRARARRRPSCASGSVLCASCAFARERLAVLDDRPGRARDRRRPCRRRGSSIARARRSTCARVTPISCWRSVESVNGACPGTGAEGAGPPFHPRARPSARPPPAGASSRRSGSSPACRRRSADASRTGTSASSRRRRRTAGATLRQARASATRPAPSAARTHRTRTASVRLAMAATSAAPRGVGSRQRLADRALELGPGHLRSPRRCRRARGARSRWRAGCRAARAGRRLPDAYAASVTVHRLLGLRHVGADEEVVPERRRAHAQPRLLDVAAHAVLEAPPVGLRRRRCAPWPPRRRRRTSACSRSAPSPTPWRRSRRERRS